MVCSETMMESGFPQVPVTTILPFFKRLTFCHHHASVGAAEPSLQAVRNSSLGEVMDVFLGAVSLELYSTNWGTQDLLSGAQPPLADFGQEKVGLRTE